MKPTSIKEFFEQASPEYKQGWDDAIKALDTYLSIESNSRPGEYQRSIDKLIDYIFKGINNEYIEPNSEYKNALERELEDRLYDEKKIDLSDKL